MESEKVIDDALKQFADLLREQLSRVERLKAGEDWIDYRSVKTIIIGVVGGDGIGPIICGEAKRVLEYMLNNEITEGKVELRDINGLTIENRAAVGKAIPADVLDELKKCHVILKGPTTTPRKGDAWPELESANVSLRREFDLFANVRPVRLLDQGIDWIFIRENTEGSYILGKKGVAVTDDLAVDFTVTTDQGSERIIEFAFDYALKNNMNKVSVVTKANIIKTTDGKFLAKAEEVAKKYPDIEWDDWYIDIMTAKLLDPARRNQFKVVVLPNLYGDIITDEAAQIQGGVGTAGSANLGKRYAMFEAIHGSAPRMVEDGRAHFADPQSMLRAVVMLLKHIGYPDRADKLEKALDICYLFDPKNLPTGRAGGGTAKEVTDHLIETLADSNLEERWRKD